MLAAMTMCRLTIRTTGLRPPVSARPPPRSASAVPSLSATREQPSRLGRGGAGQPASCRAGVPNGQGATAALQCWPVGLYCTQGARRSVAHSDCHTIRPAPALSRHLQGRLPQGPALLAPAPERLVQRAAQRHLLLPLLVSPSQLLFYLRAPHACTGSADLAARVAGPALSCCYQLL